VIMYIMASLAKLAKDCRKWKIDREDSLYYNLKEAI